MRLFSLIMCMFFVAAVAQQVRADMVNKPIEFPYRGDVRSYILHEQPWAEGGALRPLVLVLHGGGGHADNAIQMTHFSDVAVKEGAVVVYPNGSGRFKRMDYLKTWNATHCCAYAMKEHIDDVGFFRALITHLIQTKQIDPKRVYVTGMSNGGMMSHRLGIALSDQIAAIAPVVGALFGDEYEPQYPVSVMIINGAHDHSVPLQGGPLKSRAGDASDSTHMRPAAYQGEFWAKANHCTAGKPVLGNASTPVSRYPFICPKGVDVVRYVVEDMGHAWPGGKAGRKAADAPSTSFDASKQIWEFFKRHPKS